MIFTIVIAVLLVLVTVFKHYKKRLFAWFESRMAKTYNGIAFRQKSQMFKHLDENAKRAGKHNLKVWSVILVVDFCFLHLTCGSAPKQVLEVGGGSGTNFEFVDNPVEWTIIEPNLEFTPHFKENVELRGQDHQINDLIEGCGEDMHMFKEESFDAAIVSLVLCTVADVKKTLQEILRVLKPGGNLYFIEHVAAPKGMSIEI